MWQMREGSTDRAVQPLPLCFHCNWTATLPLNLFQGEGSGLGGELPLPGLHGCALPRCMRYTWAANLWGCTAEAVQ